MRYVGEPKNDGEKYSRGFPLSGWMSTKHTRSSPELARMPLFLFVVLTLLESHFSVCSDV
jgi:hypothetical protein